MRKFPRVKPVAKKEKNKLRILEEIKFRCSEISAASPFLDELSKTAGLSTEKIAKADYSKKEIEVQAYNIKALLKKIKTVT